MLRAASSNNQNALITPPDNPLDRSGDQTTPQKKARLNHTIALPCRKELALEYNKKQQEDPHSLSTAEDSHKDAPTDQNLSTDRDKKSVEFTETDKSSDDRGNNQHDCETPPLAIQTQSSDLAALKKSNVLRKAGSSYFIQYFEHLAN
ncbi:unnamed protein product [Urochloa humidicola]